MRRQAIVTLNLAEHYPTNALALINRLNQFINEIKEAANEGYDTLSTATTLNNYILTITLEK